jgi:dolichyl-phosphate beta-glucosyltransferase
MSSRPRPRTVALSIVIPAYREAARLPANLARIAEFFRRTPLPGVEPGEPCEVLVMVEKSDDDTLARCRAAAASLRAGEEALSIEVIDNVVQRGKGHAVRSGMLRARGAITLFMDADLSTPLETIPRFLAHFATHPATEVLIGNRRHPAARLARRQGWLRRRLGGLFSTLVRAVSGGDALLPPAARADTQCGFKAFRQSAAREIFSRQQLDGFSFDVEVLALAAALQLQVEDLPVDWENSPGSTLRLVQDGWTMLRDLVAVRTLVRRTLRERPGPRSSRGDASAVAEARMARDPEQTHV